MSNSNGLNVVSCHICVFGVLAGSTYSVLSTMPSDSESSSSLSSVGTYKTQRVVNAGVLAAL